MASRHGPLTDARLLESERWQRRIYLSIFDIDGSSAPEWISPAAIELNQDVRWMLLPSAFEALDDSIASRTWCPATPHFRPLPTPGPEFIQIFRAARHPCDLHIYTSEFLVANFWEGRAKSREARIHRRLGPLFVDGAEDPLELGASEDNLALRYWGTCGREYKSGLLNELTECDFDEHFVRACTDWCNSVVAPRAVQQYAHSSTLKTRSSRGNLSVDCGPLSVVSHTSTARRSARISTKIRHSG